ncbi:MAG: FxsA family protein [Acidobacteria bacterium]|nr:MAG: FxsA family protein [Acidobacteriota bacterium]REK03584.1 MAG: FxsA family protein [Acidobacteriota bacterium]
MAWLLLLFVALPLVELALLLQIGKVVGALPTVALVVFTGALGAFLARRQGLGVLRQIREQTAEGRVPASPIVDGVLILIAAAVLVTPGVITDLFGFFCLVPAGRRLVKRLVAERFRRAMQSGRVIVVTPSEDPVGHGRGERNVTPGGPVRPPDQR